VLSTPFVRHRRLLVFVALCVAALALVTAQLRSPDQRRIGWPGAAVEFALAPLTAAASRVGGAVWGAWATLEQIGTLRTENARLAARVAELEQENANLRPAAEENARLRALLAFKQAQTYQTVAASVIARDPSLWFSTVLVDRGARDGVRRDDAAVTADGLVGHVIEVGPAWSRVLLLQDPRSAVGVVVERSREAGIAQGQGQPVVRVRYLAQDADVQPGDVIVTSGVGEIYPKDLVVGRVIGVSRTGEDMFQDALVQPAADLAHLEELLIIVRSARPPGR
jgi:rod shape-determining protein MreC